MEASTPALLKFLIPKTPFILKTALAHTLSLSDTSSKWDLRTELTIRILRHILGPDSPTSTITKQQRLTTKDPGVKGPVWVSKVKCDLSPEDNDAGLRDAVFNAIVELNVPSDREGNEKEILFNTNCTPQPLEAEWHGYRANVTPSTPEPANMSETEKYASLIKETTSKVTILYFHGGAMFLLDPSTYRDKTSRLAKDTGGRVYSVRYRLAPQNPFPAALLDAFHAYLTLLYPPPDAPHTAIPASEIVFAGDSAGGNLCTALLQLLLQLNRSSYFAQNPLTFHTHKIDHPIPLPAALALVSPWLDVTRSLPSVESFAHFDYLPSPSQTHGIKIPSCPAWPSPPPRADLYCETAALCHPLVSPIAARDWTGSPPVFFSVGQEMLRDEGAVLAQRLHAQNVPVLWREFEAAPHVFAYMLEHFPGTAIHFKDFEEFCRGVVEGEEGRKGVKSSAQFISGKTVERRAVRFEELTELGDDEVSRLMGEGKKRLGEKFERERSGVSGVGREGEGSAEVRPML
ncbi:acetyl-hydrolase [Dendryphion nanum]|uniref:Acetyl-hydrolase n=1 Tax=Dendryphion nanum TaxID=256645 RepID=A0A9P9J253_9PLEO|nr:acetyl-hydrolase [Dendryphion nanum]